MPKPHNMQANRELTAYAVGIMQDIEPILRLANLFAPTVPTGATAGTYNIFEETQAFKAYNTEVTRRAIGGQAQIIQLLTTVGQFLLDPYGLRIPIDNYERDMVGADGMGLLRESKTRTLMVNCALSHLMHVIGLARTAVAAEAGAGDWGNPNIDPIKEINEIIVAIWKATGLLPNRVVIDFGAWVRLVNNPNTIGKYMPGADLAQVNAPRVQSLLIAPSAQLEIAESTVLDTGGLANPAATKKGVLSGSVYAFRSSPVPTIYDPSFMKTFGISQQLFTGVYNWVDVPHVEYIENDWTSQTKVISSKLCKRIDVA